jgi:hypothetical protein
MGFWEFPVASRLSIVSVYGRFAAHKKNGNLMFMPAKQA